MVTDLNQKEGHMQLYDIATNKTGHDVTIRGMTKKL